MIKREVMVLGATDEAATTPPSAATHPPPHITAAVSRRRKNATCNMARSANPASVRIGSSAIKSTELISSLQNVRGCGGQCLETFDRRPGHRQHRLWIQPQPYLQRDHRSEHGERGS